MHPSTKDLDELEPCLIHIAVQRVVQQFEPVKYVPDVDAIANMLREGYSYSYICNTLCTSSATVSRAAKALGLSRNEKRAKRLTLAQKRAILRDARAGVPGREIARRHNIAGSTARSYVTKARRENTCAQE